MILVTEFMAEEGLSLLEAAFPTVYAPEMVDDPAGLRRYLQDHAHLQDHAPRALIVRNRTQVTADLLSLAPGLVCVGRLGVGLDNIDVDSCKARDIAVIPATGANARSVAEYVITCALMLVRGAYDKRDFMLAGEWPRQQLSQGREIGGQTLGLAGFGSTAQQAAKIAQGLGMNSLAYDPYLADDHAAWALAKRVERAELFSDSDIISLHLPLTDETRYFLDEAALRSMKPGSIVINAGRGGLVDEAALGKVLKQGHLGGAALDVFEEEPLSGKAAHDFAARFADCNNLILTPHIAGVTLDSNRKVSQFIASEVITVLRAAGQA